jgi:hypothetical protein
MVIDAQVNDALLALFPPDFVARREREGISRVKGVEARSLEELRRYVCDFVMPPDLVPLFLPGDGLLRRMRPTRCGIRLADERLVVLAEGVPVFALEAIGDGVFAITGLATGCVLELGVDDAGVVSIGVVIRGVQADLFHARLGKIRGQTSAERRVELELVP